MEGGEIFKKFINSQQDKFKELYTQTHFNPTTKDNKNLETIREKYSIIFRERII